MKQDTFQLNNNVLEITDEYKYLGIIFKPSGSFTKANEYLCKKARKASFCIYKTLNSNSVNIQPHLKLFEACIKPILLYCSEVLSLDILMKENATINSRHFLFQQVKVQMKFCKNMLGLHKTASNMAVLGDLGVYPCSIDALKLAVGFWHHVVNSNSNSLIKNVYEHLQSSDWYCAKIKMLFKKIDFNHVWGNQNSFSQ